MVLVVVTFPKSMAEMLCAQSAQQQPTELRIPGREIVGPPFVRRKLAPWSHPICALIEGKLEYLTKGTFKLVDVVQFYTYIRGSIWVTTPQGLLMQALWMGRG